MRLLINLAKICIIIRITISNRAASCHTLPGTHRLKMFICSHATKKRIHKWHKKRPLTATSVGWNYYPIGRKWICKCSHGHSVVLFRSFFKPLISNKLTVITKPSYQLLIWEDFPFTHVTVNWMFLVSLNKQFEYNTLETLSGTVMMWY